jgi:hypothetical protein
MAGPARRACRIERQGWLDVSAVGSAKADERTAIPPGFPNPVERAPHANSPNGPDFSQEVTKETKILKRNN